jgi:hypothetical protein
MGEFLVHSFVDSHFGADLGALTEPIPETVRKLGGYWITLYLCWIFRVKVQAKYGDTFFKTAFEAARSRLALADGTVGFADGLTYWFRQLDGASTAPGQTIQGVEVPVEYFAALSFLFFTPESPFFQQIDIPSDVALDVAQALETAKKSALRLIEASVEIGGPWRGLGAEDGVKAT